MFIPAARQRGEPWSSRPSGTVGQSITALRRGVHRFTAADVRRGSGEYMARPLSSFRSAAPSVTGTTTAPQIGVDPYAALPSSDKTPRIGVSGHVGPRKGARCGPY